MRWSRAPNEPAMPPLPDRTSETCALNASRFVFTVARRPSSSRTTCCSATFLKSSTVCPNADDISVDIRFCVASRQSIRCECAAVVSLSSSKPCCKTSIRSSSFVHRALSVVHCFCCCSCASCTSVRQALQTLLAARWAIVFTFALKLLFVAESSSTQSLSRKKEFLNPARFSMDLQSLRKSSSDPLRRPSSFTCCCTCAVTLRSVFRHSSKRELKVARSAFSTTVCMA
mmetsp:Transcript_94302/g.186947  ORF Transcript_94302/g.186947 Transcript_94302/m.186947 type:complete len:229 (-) Transcript_94302:58-744(-)